QRLTVLEATHQSIGDRASDVVRHALILTASLFEVADNGFIGALEEVLLSLGSRLDVFNDLFIGTVEPVKFDLGTVLYLLYDALVFFVKPLVKLCFLELLGFFCGFVYSLAECFYGLIIEW